MSFLEDAQAFMQKKSQQETVVDDTRERLIKRLRDEFENATRTEVERALDKLAEREDIPDNFHSPSIINNQIHSIHI